MAKRKEQSFLKEILKTKKIGYKLCHLERGQSFASPIFFVIQNPKSRGGENETICDYVRISIWLVPTGNGKHVLRVGMTTPTILTEEA